MNVTLNSFNSYNQYNNQNRQCCKPKPQSFTANPAQVAGDVIDLVAEQATKEKSGFFKPITDLYDKFTDKIAEHFTAKIIDSKPMLYIAKKLRNSENLFQHCLTLGSLVTSGLYMEKTLTNDKLDKDRKQTLAVNQGLTFIASTAGAYSLDKYLKNWWENTTSKYIGTQIDNENFAKNFKGINQGIDEINKKLKQNPKGDVNKFAEEVKEALKMPKKGEQGYKGFTDFLEHAVKGAIEDAADAETSVKTVERLKLDKYTDKLVKNGIIKEEKITNELKGKIKGMGALKSILVFGFVYRYFVPVVVTKPANWLCEKYLSHKKAKNEAKQDQTQKA